MFDFAVCGVKLRNLLKQFAKMPTEEFMAKLFKNKIVAASAVGDNSAVEMGHESHSKLVIPSSEVIVGEPASELPEVHLKEKKRHREGHISRPHHTKKLKEPMSGSGKMEMTVSAKSGVETRIPSTPGVSALGDAASGGIRLCKAYADKVCRWCCFCLFLFSL